MTKPQGTDHPTVIIVRGLPGSGKTYLAVALEDALGKDRVVMLDPDTTDYNSQEYLAHTKALSAEGVDEKLHAYRFLRAKAYQGIADRKIIIWNQPFSNLEIFNKMVANLHNQASEHNTHLSLLVVEVEIDHAIAKERVQKRKQEGGHGPSDEVFTRFLQDYKSFAEEGYNTVTVHGDTDIATSVPTVMQALHDLWAKDA